MNRRPRLSIGVPVYNGESFLPGLLENLTRQTFRDFEIIISDNASTDGTAEICREWMQRDERIRYSRNPQNVGASANFNKVFALSQSPLFKWAPVDDTYAPDYLETCVAILDENPDVMLAQTDVVCVDLRGKPFEKDAATGGFIIPGTKLSYFVDPIDVGESASAIMRFYDVLFRCRSNAQIFGVMRREALAQTGLLPNYLGAEKATVLELALTGRFRQDRGAKFYRCYHPGITEVKDSAEGKRYIAVSDTGYSRPMRMLASFIGTPRGKPIGFVTKAACYVLLGARAVVFAVRSLMRREVKDWPFRAAWGSTKGRNLVS